MYESVRSCYKTAEPSESDADAVGCRLVKTQGTMYHTSVHNDAIWQIRLHILHVALMSLWNNANRILK